MEEKIVIEGWKLAYIQNETLKSKRYVFKDCRDIYNSEARVIDATVPGNFELDLMRENLLDDVYQGTNSIKTQTLEMMHLYYFTEFFYEKKSDKDCFFVFEGIDTVAEIYVDGELLGFTENMLHAHRFKADFLEEGKHELLVHIIPSVIYARDFEIPSMCVAPKYNWDSLVMRKAPYMYGWDIMPRIVSGGIWKPVELVYVPKTRIVNHFTYTKNITEESAWLITSMRLIGCEDCITDYTVKIEGRCKDSTFKNEYVPFSTSFSFATEIRKPLLWWPKNYGQPNLYDVEIKLYYKDMECDCIRFKTGVRTVKLDRTSCSGDDGEFCFIINGRKVFVLGTNWVPCDAFPSRHDEYTLRNLEMVNDLNCNMLRCWGGNVYPSQMLYEYCDEHGIMVWQDFALGCAHYPDDDRICSLMQKEVREVILSYRNHAALVLWAGDNECDQKVCAEDCFVPHTKRTVKALINPNKNKLTREIIAKELRNYDATRPYLPSSPYIDEMAFIYGLPSEMHLWGPRDFFKGEFYMNSDCHFASEMGYHGCPSPNSIGKFISKEHMPKTDIHEICDDPEWLVHGASPELTKNTQYAYRNALMIRQVERLFGVANNDIAIFAKQSQISQAEALKFFIERFRVQKWRKTGLLWWNIADGWPQVSDAVVDWYGCKKLAYSYIKRSQAPLCLMCNEPTNGKLPLVAVNDLQESQKLEYRVENVLTSDVVCEGYIEIEANDKVEIRTIEEQKGAFYVISWKTEGGDENKNHYCCSIGDKLDFATYMRCLEKLGFDKGFEGF